MAQTLQEAHDAFYDALNVMLTGDAGPICAIWSRDPSITNSGPFGPTQVGPDAVLANFEQEASRKLGGAVRVTEVQVYEGEDLGVTSCVEHGEGHTIDGKPASLEHRVTNVFRREADGWRMVRHHTDRSG